MIVHVSTNQSGGAGNAARRLHEGLQADNIESVFVSALGTANSRQHLEILAKRYPRFWNRAAQKLGLCLSEQEKWNRTTARMKLAGTFASGIHTDSTLLEHARLRKASIINLHWVAGILPWRTFFQGISCPVVWTLHDMNPFLGIFHYETDRQRASVAAQQLDAQILEQKRRIFASGTAPVIVSPSAWLRNKAQNSELFGQFQHRHIPYGLNPQVFRPYSQVLARSVFCLPTDRKLMLVVAERLDDYRKGFDLLLTALQIPELAAEWDLVAVGQGEIPLQSLKYHRIGTISDDRLMALAYSAADMTVIASREDNLPNVILESLCCGTPVVGTPAGGIPEPIIPGRDGFIAESITSAGLSRAIREAMLHSFDREMIAKEAAARFDGALQAKRYQALYSELCNEAHGSRT